MAWTIWDAPSDRDYQEQFNPYPGRQEKEPMSDDVEYSQYEGAAYDELYAKYRVLKGERDTLRVLLREILAAEAGGYFRQQWYGPLIERITAALKEAPEPLRDKLAHDESPNL